MLRSREAIEEELEYAASLGSEVVDVVREFNHLPTQEEILAVLRTSVHPQLIAQRYLEPRDEGLIVLRPYEVAPRIYCVGDGFYHLSLKVFDRSRSDHPAKSLH